MLSSTSLIPRDFPEHHNHNLDSYQQTQNITFENNGNSNNGKDKGSKEPSPTLYDDANYSPIWHCVVAGGFGGAIGDTLMHSLDTLKTRQQATTTSTKTIKTLAAIKNGEHITFMSILRTEGITRGLYSGYTAAMLGSFPNAAIFFGTYESLKRAMIDKNGYNETFSHLTAGFMGDLVSSFIYVPSEVLKTRLQLQGRFNRKLFGYNGLRDAIYKIYKNEGLSAFFFGYKATLWRDLPFSALQFAFYEKFRQYATELEKISENDYNVEDHSKELSLISELATGAAAGGLAGILTTPMDVIKTRIQTSNEPVNKDNKVARCNNIDNLNLRKKSITTLSNTNIDNSTSLKSTSSMLRGLLNVYQSEGINGFFSGVGPRFVWTSIQSSVMLLLYQVCLKELNRVTARDKKLLC
ncbi:related to mitochondrial carrier protein [Saccharomycodes ludwigii]|uniref:Related to mitochondrial carrier protein n=1 Tax=Saccharomycodes ludwigii TaxID=36035 RepID=A0A376B7G8_9ASCO|nr:hypothetical protein SCDLUD_002689 [Saccharomycodes ludwigii]KAH3901203.1 hypothetical protein SCDLUD_002689 [Saccharomycodes ludwigii]SSD60646.1 related to mitochondrial carrier protein [Saccharomycodes ludwigii]